MDAGRAGPTRPVCRWTFPSTNWEVVIAASSCTGCRTSGWTSTRTIEPHDGPPLFRYQFKGLYPALEEAARLSPSLRTRLEHLIDEVTCSVCGGSRLRDDAAAVRFQGATIDELCRRPLGELQRDIARLEIVDHATDASPANCSAKSVVAWSS